ncbi:hypothetical protein FQN57_003721 [Myotisia sp. PD_48]|nr:hypothetical protein FQN57_003721 [Myotisia sp. PD_48]
MPPDRSCFTTVNIPQSFSLPDSMEYFSITAGPNTDLWRKPPDRETATAPIIYTSLRRPFVIAEVTVTADLEMEWDQGGLVIFTGPAPGSNLVSRMNSDPLNLTAIPRTDVVDLDTNGDQNPANPQAPEQQNERPPPYPSHNLGQGKWVKAGLEFSAGTVNATSVSATSDGADWCLAPLAPPNQPTSITSLRIKLERIGHSLWVWYQIPSSSLSPEHYFQHPPAYSQQTPQPASTIRQSWRKLREVTWFFWGVEDKSVHVGVYASRPANITNTMWASREGGGRYTGVAGPSRGNDNDSNGHLMRNALTVEFEDLEIF